MPSKFIRSLILAVALATSLHAATTLTGEAALKHLRAGNERFVAGQPAHGNQSVARRQEVAAGQSPFAAILSCADSRVPAEIIFDQGLGDIFSVRVAGNVAGTDEIGSLEYATGHLGAPLLLVLGHAKCGAVSAVVTGAEVHGNIPAALSGIEPVAERVRHEHPAESPDKLIGPAIDENVRHSIEEILSRSPLISELVRANKVRIEGAVYDLETGAIRWLGEHPQQAKYLSSEASAHGSETAHAGSAAGSVVQAHGTGAHPAHAPHDNEALQSHTAFWAAGIVALLALVLFAVRRLSVHHMRDWTIGRRIALGFGGILAVLALVAFVGWKDLHEAFLGFEEYSADARHSNLVGTIQEEFLEMRAAALDYQITHAADDADVFHEQKNRLDRSLAEATKELREPARVELLGKARTQIADYGNAFDDYVKTGRSVRHPRKAALVSRMAELGRTIDRELADLKREYLADQNRAGPRITHEMREAQRMIVVIAIAAVVLAAGLSWLISRSIISVLQGTTVTLSAGSTQTAAAATEISHASQSLAEGASEQAASLEETSASLEEVSGMTKRNAQNAQSARELSGEARQTAEAGATGMQVMGRSMEGIRQASSEMRVAMDGIKSASADVSRIIKTIDEIAFQTNLLALNAAVEAARAGEAGAGFAVVADEVRSLAQRSATAAKETAEKIEASIKRSEECARVTEKVTAAVEDVATKVGDVGRHLAEILAKSQQVDGQVAQIASASAEQSQGIAQVATAVSQIDKITQTNAAAAEQSAAAAEELNAQAGVLREAVARLEKLAGASFAPASAQPAPEDTRAARSPRANPGFRPANAQINVQSPRFVTNRMG